MAERVQQSKLAALGRLSASIAAVSPTDTPDPAAVSAFIAKAEFAAADATTAPDIPPPVEAENTPSVSMGLPDPAPAYANFFHAHGVSAYGNVDLNGASANADQVAQLDTKFTASYADRGLLFFREKKEKIMRLPPPCRYTRRPPHTPKALAPLQYARTPPYPQA